MDNCTWAATMAAAAGWAMTGGNPMGFGWNGNPGLICMPCIPLLLIGQPIPPGWTWPLFEPTPTPFLSTGCMNLQLASSLQKPLFFQWQHTMELFLVSSSGLAAAALCFTAFLRERALVASCAAPTSTYWLWLPAEGAVPKPMPGGLEQDMDEFTMRGWLADGGNGRMAVCVAPLGPMITRRSTTAHLPSMLICLSVTVAVRSEASEGEDSRSPGTCMGICSTMDRLPLASAGGGGRSGARGDGGMKDSPPAAWWPLWRWVKGVLS
mmetsp:Transcript_20692/g.58049  ORF Transcript_20692/g.58049 Transcript_20692/m.58049 type:complete len:266 (+) Transcript_20692:111-908(+)